MKDWEEYKRMWADEVERLRNSEDEIDKLCYKYLEEGLIMSRIPPVGVELSIVEYKELKDAGYNLNEIHGWCYSGRAIHERVRPYDVGLNTPRKGFYFVRQIIRDKSIFVCYYNYKDCKEFLEETVEISKIPFYNYVSTGPVKQQIGVGDIIEVSDQPILKEYSENGHNKNSYKIVWSLKKHPQLSFEECKKIQNEINMLKETAACYERIVSDAQYDRAEVRACIKEKLDQPFTDDDIIKAQAELKNINEQIAFYYGLLENCGIIK